MKLDSLDIELGSPAADFSLPGVDGKTHTLGSAVGEKATLVAFICNHCPFVVHIADGLAAFARDYAQKGLSVVAINANDVERYPADSPARMASFAEAHGFVFPYLYDETQEIAKAYRAVCTPDFFLYDERLELAYAGQFDASRPGRHDVPVTGDSLRAAADAVLTGAAMPSPQIPSSGCSLKWKPGYEPA